MRGAWQGGEYERRRRPAGLPPPPSPYGGILNTVKGRGPGAARGAGPPYLATWPGVRPKSFLKAAMKAETEA